jgi:hypothetical protein
VRRRTAFERGARALLGGGLLAGGAACRPPEWGRPVGAAEVYVGLGRAREVAILDAVTDTVRRRISLAPLGERGLPWRLGVGPAGNAAMVPLVGNEPRVGLIAPAPPAEGRGGVRWRQAGSGRAGGDGSQECAWLRVGTGRPAPGRAGVWVAPEAPQTLAADARGQAYVLLADAAGREPSHAAVVDLRRGAVLRHLPLSPAGESVLALLALPDGDRLATAVWRWPSTGAGGSHPGAGRLVLLDARTGAIRARSGLPDDAAVTDLALAAPPPGAAGGGGLAIYAVVGAPGPALDEDDWWAPATRFELAALDQTTLDVLAVWPLERRPQALAVAPDGSRAYLLVGLPGGWGWSQRVVVLDLVGGAARRVWPLPSGGFGLALSAAGKLYVADAFGDRLWRVDTRTDTFLGSIPLAGAPIAIAARPA